MTPPVIDWARYAADPEGVAREILHLPDRAAAVEHPHRLAVPSNALVRRP